MSDWIAVAKRLPKCPRSKDALGTPCLIWPRQEIGVAYYGKRATGKPAFYLYGAEILGVTHWMPLPEAPK